MKQTYARVGTQLAGLVLLALTAACATDTAQVAGPGPEEVRANLQAGNGGTWVAFNPLNQGRATGAFWDNYSADDARTYAFTTAQFSQPNSTGCNAGFFAQGGAGLMTSQASYTGPGAYCLEMFGPGGTYAFRGGFDNAGYTHYLGSGTTGSAAAPFMFDGSRSYTIRYLGGYRGEGSAIGYFANASSGKFFEAFDEATGSPRVPGTLIAPITFYLTPSDLDASPNWGLYIKSRNLSAVTCDPADPTKGCSDALAGVVGRNGVVNQQWALFSNATRTRFLAGAEDNQLEVMPNSSYRDSDYQDYFIEIIPSALNNTPGNGCSPGFWKRSARNEWPSVGTYKPSMTFASVFGANTTYPAETTLLQVLQKGGGGAFALGRQAVGALLNSATSGFPLGFGLSADQVIADYNAAMLAGGTEIERQKDAFEEMIDVGIRTCPLMNNNKRIR